MITRIFRFLFPLLVIGGIIFGFYWLWNNYNQLPEKKEILGDKLKTITNFKKTNTPPKNTIPLVINEKTFFVKVVDTPATRQKGLMFRKSLPQNQGMFFVFERPNIYDFWMPNVSFPLDIVWINKDFKVVDIITAPPCLEKNIQKCPSFKPKAIAKYVLEVNANAFDGVVGDFVEIKL